VGDVLFRSESQTLEAVEGADGKIGGFLWEHLTPDADKCMAYVEIVDKYARVGVVGHELTSLKPLSLTPSLDCPNCPAHGFVTMGKWEGSGVFRPPVFQLEAIRDGVFRVVEKAVAKATTAWSDPGKKEWSSKTDWLSRYPKDADDEDGWGGWSNWFGRSGHRGRMDGGYL
jgi:hypothetical protein